MEYLVPVITGVTFQPNFAVVTLKVFETAETSVVAKVRRLYVLASNVPAKVIFTVPERVSAPVTAKVFPKV